MKRLGLVLVVVLMGAGVADASHPWDGISGRRHPWDYRYRTRPVVQVGVGYGYSYGYGSGCGSRVGSYRDDNEALYGPGSVSDFFFGWRADRVLKMQEKEQDFRHEQERRAEDKEIFEKASQRAKDQKLEDENQRLQQENAELKKELSEIKKMIQKLLAKKGK